MAMEKSLYQAPLGEAQGIAPLDIELEGAPQETLEDGSVEITIVPEDITDEGVVDGLPFDANLAEFMDASALTSIASELIDAYDNDLMSRKDWEQSYAEGLKLLGLKYEQRTEPWIGACGVFSPIIAEAAVRFQAEAIMETFPAQGPVKTKILGKITPENTAAAQRVQEDMNYELTEVMKEYRAEHEKMLWNLPLAGSAFKKVYFDPSLGRQVSVFVPAEDVIIPYGVSEISMGERLTHRMRKTVNQLEKLQDSGFYRDDINIPDGPVMMPDDVQQAKDRETGFTATYDDRPLVLEMQVEMDIPEFRIKGGDGKRTSMPLPYVVTLLRDTQDVLAIRRNWEPDGEDAGEPKTRDGKDDYEPRLARQYFVHYQYVPGFGAYGFGLLHLVGNSARSATAITRQLVDAGTLATLPGGMKTRGLRIKGDDTPIAPGEFRDVDVASGTLRDNIMPLPYKEPSGTLLQLRGIIVEEAQKFAAAPDMQISDMSAQAPVGTTLALIERNLKVMSAVQARMHFSMKQEFKLLSRLVRDYASRSYGYEPESGKKINRQSDYAMVEVIPVSDPNASTLAQRVVQYQAVIQLAATAPQIYNLPKLHRQMLEVLNIKGADELVPLEEDMRPTDPVTENQNLLTMKPVKAFLNQDHEAHIQVHMAAMQDPKIMQVLGQNPQAQALLQAAHSHVTEHVAFAYRQRITQELGVSMPPPDAKLSPEVEAQISPLLADAAGKLLQKNTAEIQAQQAQQAQQDPLVQMQQKDMAIKEKDSETKAKAMQAEAAYKADMLKLERDKFELESQVKGLTVAAAAKKQSDNQQLAGAKLGVEIAKTHKQHGHEASQQDAQHAHEVGQQIGQLGHDAHTQGVERNHQINQSQMDHQMAMDQQAAQAEAQAAQAAQQPAAPKKRATKKKAE